MESDHEDNKSSSKLTKKGDVKEQLNMSHEDLSDVSDLDSMGNEELKETKVTSLKCICIVN